MRPWERGDADGEEDEEAGCSNTDANTSSANASTSSNTAPSSGGARRNGGGASEAGWGNNPVSGATINLSREYTLAIQTSSYNEIWAKIHVEVDGQRVDGGGGGDEDEEDRCTLAGVLRPEDAVVERALGDAPDTELTRLAADYLSSTHHASLLCLSLCRSLRRARTLYGPITDILALIAHAPPLAALHCDCAFDAFLLFDQIPNPFLPPAAGFQGMHRSFAGLKNHLDLRLLRARRRRRLLRCAARGSGICLIACAIGAAIAGLVIATHAITALLAAAPACAALRGSCCPTPAWMKRLQEHMDRLDAAARGAYVLNNDVDTIERLVGRLHATVESDKILVRLGLERGRGQHHTIEEVVRQLRKNHPSLLRQLADLEEHICLYFAAVNRASTALEIAVMLNIPLVEILGIGWWCQLEGANFHSTRHAGPRNYRCLVVHSNFLHAILMLHTCRGQGQLRIPILPLQHPSPILSATDVLLYLFRHRHIRLHSTIVAICHSCFDFFICTREPI